jgi:hypothetical protein
VTQLRSAADPVHPVRPQAPDRPRPCRARHHDRPFTRYPATDDDLDPRIEWIGPDDRGIELEIIAVELPDMWLVIHVMPTALRRNR